MWEIKNCMTQVIPIVAGRFRNRKQTPKCLFLSPPIVLGGAHVCTKAESPPPFPMYPITEKRLKEQVPEMYKRWRSISLKKIFIKTVALVINSSGLMKCTCPRNLTLKKIEVQSLRYHNVFLFFIFLLVFFPNRRTPPICSCISVQVATLEDSYGISGWKAAAIIYLTLLLPPPNPRQS